jgi:hypothetical protein
MNTPKVPPGYTADELERDNPHNAWMYEHDEYGGDVDDPEDPDGEEGYCPTCSGSGEGQYDGTRCWACKGKGFQR